MSSISRLANAMGRAYVEAGQNPADFAFQKASPSVSPTFSGKLSTALPSEPDGATYRRMKVLARNAYEDRQNVVDFDGVQVPLCVLQDHISYVEEQRARIGNALYVFENNVFHWRTP